MKHLKAFEGYKEDMESLINKAKDKLGFKSKEQPKKKEKVKITCPGCDYYAEESYGGNFWHIYKNVPAGFGTRGAYARYPEASIEKTPSGNLILKQSRNVLLKDTNSGSGSPRIKIPSIERGIKYIDDKRKERQIEVDKEKEKFDSEITERKNIRK